MQSAARALILSAALMLSTVPAPASSVPAETSPTQRTLTVSGVGITHAQADTTRVIFMLMSVPKPASIPQQLGNTLQQLTLGQQAALQTLPPTREALRPLLEVLERESVGAGTLAFESPAGYPNFGNLLNTAKLSVDVQPGRERRERVISAVAEAARTGGFQVNQSLAYNRLNDCLPLEKRARVEALAKARARALELASVTGVRLGRVLGVKETGEARNGLCGSTPFPNMLNGIYGSGDDVEWRTVLEVTYELK